MNRLLFAAARGARIQADFNGEWYCVHTIKFVSPSYTYRIHPDDEHLQYGPVSTSLRKMGERPPKTFNDFKEQLSAYMAGHWMTKEDAMYMSSNASHRSRFLLILAEALADEGL